MNLETVCTLNYGDYEDRKVIHEEDKIKIYLHNGEILIGIFSDSDSSSLFIDRDSDSINIEFTDIKDIEQLDNE